TLRSHISYCSPSLPSSCSFFTCTTPTTPAIYTLSLHDALPICSAETVIDLPPCCVVVTSTRGPGWKMTGPTSRFCDGLRSTPKRSEEHTSELQSPYDLVCRLLLEKKNYEQVGVTTHKNEPCMTK